MAVLFIGSVVAFVVALLIGGLAIYANARVAVDIDDYKPSSRHRPDEMDGDSST